ncbi:MAG: hypothetical protein WAW36_12620 [Methylovulum miyakonense]|uniref:hypothetical protein n=1 Tax=Methylovulum miyakonense TaxID=645578 RepID=UPI003BB7F645
MPDLFPNALRNLLRQSLRNRRQPACFDGHWTARFGHGFTCTPFDKVKNAGGPGLHISLAGEDVLVVARHYR